jgi:phenylacetate-CoA ligase
MVLERYSEMIAHPVMWGRARKATTGGSTGRPVTVLNDKGARVEANLWRVVRWWGVEPYDDSAYIYRSTRAGLRRRLNDVAWWPTRRIFLDASLMTPESMLTFAEKCNALQPRLLQGYVGAVYEFALFLRDRGISIAAPKAVWVTAAPLLEHQREVMEKVFEAPVYDQYRTCEVPWLAAECPAQNGLHMMHDMRAIEFVDDQGRVTPDGAWGSVVVTDFENRVFPLIRYSLGDVGRRLTGPCDCGLSLPRMDKVRGRVSDRLLLPDGRIVSGEYLTTLFDSHPQAVTAFQVRQSADGAVRLICAPGFDPQAARWIGETFRELERRVGSTVKVSLEQTSHIPHDAGKTRFIVSDVAHRS